MIRQGKSADTLAPLTRAEQLRETARGHRAKAAEGRRALPGTRVANRPGLTARIHHLERLASELERAAQMAEEVAA